MVYAVFLGEVIGTMTQADGNDVPQSEETSMWWERAEEHIRQYVPQPQRREKKKRPCTFYVTLGGLVDFRRSFLVDFKATDDKDTDDKATDDKNTVDKNTDYKNTVDKNTVDEYTVMRDFDFVIRSGPFCDRVHVSGVKGAETFLKFFYTLRNFLCHGDPSHVTGKSMYKEFVKDGDLSAKIIADKDTRKKAEAKIADENIQPLLEECRSVIQVKQTERDSSDPALPSVRINTQSKTKWSAVSTLFF